MRNDAKRHACASKSPSASLVIANIAAGGFTDRAKTFRFFALLFAMVCAGACHGPKDSVYDPTRFHITRTLLPADMEQPVRGVYTQQPSGNAGALCCWLSAHAAFRLKKTESARTIRLTLYVPDVPAFARGAQKLTLSLASPGNHHRTWSLQPGFQTLTMSIPPATPRRQSTIGVRLDFSRDFAPIASSPQRPRYAALVTSIYVD